jgi:hypothetical protein
MAVATVNVLLLNASHLVLVQTVLVAAQSRQRDKEDMR